MTNDTLSIILGLCALYYGISLVMEMIRDGEASAFKLFMLLLTMGFFVAASVKAGGWFLMH